MKPSDFQTITVKEYVVSLFVISGLVPTGFLTIWMFKPELIHQLETSKLVLLSLSLTIPFFIFNLMAGDITENTEVGRKSFIAAGYFTMTTFYISLFVSYTYKDTFLTFLKTVIVIEALIMIRAVIQFIRRKRKEKKANQSCDTTAVSAPR